MGDLTVPATGSALECRRGIRGPGFTAFPAGIRGWAPADRAGLHRKISGSMRHDVVGTRFVAGVLCEGLDPGQGHVDQERPGTGRANAHPRALRRGSLSREGGEAVNRTGHP